MKFKYNPIYYQCSEFEQKTNSILKALYLTLHNKSEIFKLMYNSGELLKDIEEILRETNYLLSPFDQKTIETLFFSHLRDNTVRPVIEYLTEPYSGFRKVRNQVYYVNQRPIKESYYNAAIH